MTKPAYITAMELSKQWHVDYEYITQMRSRRDDPLPLFLLPGKKRGYVGRLTEIDAWIDRNRG